MALQLKIVVRRLSAWIAAWLGIATLTLGSPALAQSIWLKAETPRFTIYSMGSERSLKTYAEHIELLDAVFWETYGLQRPPPPPRKLPIYLVDKAARLRVVAPDLIDSAVGFYSASEGEIFAMGLASSGNDYVLLHEYTHHLMLQNFPSGYPAWLVEGYAEYFMSATVDDSAIKVGYAPLGRTGELSEQPWLPMEMVLTKRVSDIPKAQIGLFYGQAWLLTHYLISDPTRSQQLQAYLAAVAQGQASITAMEAATGVKTEAWERRLRAYASNQTPYTQFKRSQFENAPVQITALSKGVSDLLLDDLNIRTGIDEDRKVAVLSEVRAKAAKYPDDAFAEMAMARAEVALGDPLIGAAILKRRLAANPKDVEALALEAERLMALGDKTPARQSELYDQAGGLLAQAFSLNPERYQTLIAFAHSRLHDPDYPSANTLTALLTALKLAPQVGETRLNAAQGLMRKARYREASLVLAPLANSPHDNPQAKRAREMLIEIATATKPKP